ESFQQFDIRIGTDQGVVGLGLEFVVGQNVGNIADVVPHCFQVLPNSNVGIVGRDIVSGWVARIKNWSVWKLSGGVEYITRKGVPSGVQSIIFAPAHRQIGPHGQPIEYIVVETGSDAVAIHAVGNGNTILVGES